MVPGYNAITCEWLELMGLWNREYCCGGCHAGEEGHWLYQYKSKTGQTVMICFNAANCVEDEAIERKITECDTPELNANDQSN